MMAALFSVRHVAWLAPLVPFAALSWRLQQLADAAGQGVGADLAALAAPLAPHRVAPELDAADEAGQLDAFTAATFGSTLADAAQPAKKGARRARAAQLGAVRVSAERVLSLAERRVMPRGVPVPARGARPAGLELRGVSALGLGVRDGDVLTDAAGVPALSAAAVVGAVLAARGRHAAEISGRIFRGSESYAIVVEQPYQLTPSP